MKILSNLDLAGNELQVARLQSLSSGSGITAPGRVFYNNSTGLINYRNSTSILALATTDVAESIAATAAKQEFSNIDTLYGAGSKTRSPNDRFGDVVDLDDWLTTEGILSASASLAANDAAMVNLIAYMQANPGKTYRSRRGRTYRVGTPRTFPNDIKLMLEGATFLLDSDQSGSPMFIFGERNEVDVFTTLTANTRLVYIPVRTANGFKGDLCIKADTQQANGGFNFRAAAQIMGNDVEIGLLDVKNFDQAAIVWGDTAAGGIAQRIKIQRAKIENYVRGLGVRNARHLTVDDMFIYGRSPNATSDPGHNSVLIEGGEYVNFKGGVLRDAGEHGFRSGGFRDFTANGGTGSGWVEATRALSVSNLIIKGPGQSGFKIWKGDISTKHIGVNLSNIQVIDAASNGDAAGFNDEGFMLQGIDDLSMTGCSVTAMDLSRSCYDSFYLHSINRANLSGCRSYSPLRSALRMDEYSDGGTSGGLHPSAMNSVDVGDFQAHGSGGDAIVFNFPGASQIRDVFIKQPHIVECVKGIYANAASARFVQKCVIRSALIRGNSSTAVDVPSTGNLVVNTL